MPRKETSEKIVIKAVPYNGGEIGNTLDRPDGSSIGVVTSITKATVYDTKNNSVTNRKPVVTEVSNNGATVEIDLGTENSH